MLVSPAESRAVSAGRGLPEGWHYSTVPEKYGADFLWVVGGKRWGVQRKEINDFCASVADDRLSREIGMMKALDHAYLLLEGKVLWTTDGMLVGAKTGYGKPWNKRQWLGARLSLEDAGMIVMDSSSVKDSLEVLRVIEEWSRKGSHRSLLERGSAARGPWGELGNREYAIHFWQGLPGIGVQLAERIWAETEAHGGMMTWKDGTRERLLGVEGLGKVKVDKIMKVLGE